MVKILKIAGIKADNYTMWYRFSSSIKQKVIFVNEKKVKFSDDIVYICPSCNTEAKTILRIFNDRLCKYDNFDYMCKACVDKNHNLSIQAEKQLITKTKNKSRPRDIIKRTGKLGFIGGDQSKGSKIRNKMEQTKLINDSNTNKGTEAYFKRLTSYLQKSRDELKEIKFKANETKNKNKTTPKHKAERGEEFGFVNCSKEKRELIDAKTNEILKSIQKNGKSLMSNVAEKRVEKKRIEGKFTKKKNLTDFKNYKREVWKVTNFQNLCSLEHFEKRGRADINKQAYHLDHKFSIKEGFFNNIPPFIIGNISNLEMIPHKENCSKQDKCSILLEDLYAHVVNKNGELLETP